MEKFVHSLTTKELTLAQAGGKGANISRLIQAGLPVPHGVVINTAAYRLFVSANDLESKINHLNQSGTDPASIEDASRQIRQLFAAATLPDDLRAAIELLAQDFGQQPLAVRSSATAEDLPDPFQRFEE